MYSLYAGWRSSVTAASRDSPWSGPPGTGPFRLRPAGVEVAELPDLLRVGAALVPSGHLEVRREVLQRGMREERAEALAHLAFEHVRVAVAVRPERRRGIV